MNSRNNICRWQTQVQNCFPRDAIFFHRYWLTELISFHVSCDVLEEEERVILLGWTSRVTSEGDFVELTFFSPSPPFCPSTPTGTQPLSTLYFSMIQEWLLWPNQVFLLLWPLWTGNKALMSLHWICLFQYPIKWQYKLNTLYTLSTSGQCQWLNWYCEKLLFGLRWFNRRMFILMAQEVMSSNPTGSQTFPLLRSKPGLARLNINTLLAAGSGSNPCYL